MQATKRSGRQNAQPLGFARGEHEWLCHMEDPPGGSLMCGKQRTCKSVFLDLWQWLDLRVKSRICGK